MVSKDIILVTVDCWREDTTNQMKSLQSLPSGFSQESAVAQAAATNGVFPTLFASRYYPEVYDEDGNVRSECPTLPGELAKRGYSTGGFVASNPFLSKWQDYFGEFWNDGLGHGDGFNEGETIDNIKRLLTMRSRVAAPDLLERATKWWDSADSPRFLWLHFMDLHAPYLPGYRRVLQRGLIQSIRTLKHDWPSPRQPAPQFQSTYRRLYEDCVDYFDTFLESLFDFFPSDSYIVMTGDHGEEFDHDVWRHARLYDEVVKVPFVYSDSFSRDWSAPIHHLDIPSLLLAAIDETPPRTWRGTPTSSQSVFMANYSPNLNELYLGYRESVWKYIRTYDELGNATEELYNLAESPEEMVESGNDQKRAELSAAVDEFYSQESLDYDRVGNHSIGFGESDAVTSRLENLGYK